MDEYPRVLVISHNPFSNSQNNGKTLSAFFDGWPKDKIAQLYLTPDKPDFTTCNKFYRITDLDVLKQFVKKGVAGTEIKESEILNNEKELLHKNKGYIFIRNLFLKRSPIMYYMRNMAWKFVKPWKNKELNDWIKNFNPEVVFFQSSNVYSVFDMVADICEKFKLKLFMETTDDYVTGHFSINPFYLMDINNMIKRYKKLVDKSECIFAIGDMMAEEYKERFGGTYKVAMNSIDVSANVIPYGDVNNKRIRLLYTGNLGLNRWKILKRIGEALESINKKGILANLDIYSLERPSSKILKQLNKKDIIEYKGNLNKSELVAERNKSDILVHVESFDRKNKNITRLSVSTKIPECLLSRRCILAVGPKDIASIKYLRDNQIGKVIEDVNLKSIEKGLQEIITNRNERLKYIKNGNRVAENRHSFAKNKECVQNEILGRK